MYNKAYGDNFYYLKGDIVNYPPPKGSNVIKITTGTRESYLYSF